MSIPNATVHTVDVKKTSPLNYIELHQELDSAALVALAALTTGATVRDAADILAAVCKRGNVVTSTSIGGASHIDA